MVNMWLLLVQLHKLVPYLYGSNNVTLLLTKNSERPRDELHVWLNYHLVTNWYYYSVWLALLFELLNLTSYLIMI